jgi:hypothetical protein
MDDIQQQVQAFQGGNPSAGNLALDRLLEGGEAAERLLIGGSLEYTKTVQVRRRWLKYVSARQETAIPRLIEKLALGEWQQANMVSHLFSAVAPQSTASDSIYSLFSKDIDSEDRYYHAVLHPRWNTRQLVRPTPVRRLSSLSGRSSQVSLALAIAKCLDNGYLLDLELDAVTVVPTAWTSSHATPTGVRLVPGSSCRA